MLSIIFVVLAVLLITFAGFCVLYALGIIAPDTPDESTFLLLLMKQFGASVAAVLLVCGFLSLVALVVYLIYNLFV